MNAIIKGKCWCGGDSITVYQIIPEKRWTMTKVDSVEMGKWVFETVEAEAENQENCFREKGYSIIIAGKDFGCGSKSVEHPMAALKGAGIQLIIAESLSRYSYRNAINLGLPVITCKEIVSKVKRDDELEVNLLTGNIKNLSTGEQIQTNGLSKFAMEIISSGGLLPYIKKGCEMK